MKKTKINKTNPVAKEVRTPKYKTRIVKPKKGKGSFKRDKNGKTIFHYGYVI